MPSLQAFRGLGKVGAAFFDPADHTPQIEPSKPEDSAPEARSPSLHPAAEHPLHTNCRIILAKLPYSSDSWSATLCHRGSSLSFVVASVLMKCAPCLVRLLLRSLQIPNPSPKPSSASSASWPNQSEKSSSTLSRFKPFQPPATCAKLPLSAPVGLGPGDPPPDRPTSLSDGL